jgi:hypothetical protein
VKGIWAALLGPIVQRKFNQHPGLVPGGRCFSPNNSFQGEPHFLMLLLCCCQTDSTSGPPFLSLKLSRFVKSQHSDDDVGVSTRMVCGHITTTLIN